MSSPPTPPSGKNVVGYGEIKIEVWFTGSQENPNGEVVIRTPHGMPIQFFILGCEHLMRLVAKNSAAGFERALELLADGAMEGKDADIRQKEL